MTWKNPGMARLPLAFTSIIILCGCLGFTALGNTWIWNGGAAPDGNWNNAANWFGLGIPASGDSVIFQGSVGLNTTNNIANLTLNQIKFNNGGFVIRGNDFTITNSILSTNTSGANTFSCTNITLATGDVLITVSNGVTLNINSQLQGSKGVVKAGSGTLTFALPSGGNTYTGTTFVNLGLLTIVTPADGAFGGPLVIGDGSGVAATVRLFANQVLPNTVPITINVNGLLDLNNFSDTIGTNLTLNGSGTVATGIGTLTLSPNATVTANPSAVFLSCIIAGNLNVGSGICTFNVPTSGPLIGSLLVTAVVSGAATINKTGPGFMSYSGLNTFTGQMNVLGGTLGVSTPLALGATNGITTVSNTATLQVSASISNEALTLASTGIGLINAGGANVWACTNVTLAAPTTLEIDGVSLDIQALISGSGGFTKTGTGTLTLSGSGENTYSGATTIKEGILQLNHSSGHAIGSSSSIYVGDGIGGGNSDILRYINGANGNQVNGTIAITITNSGLYDLNGSVDEAGPFTLSGGDIATGSGELTADFGDFTVPANNTRTPTISGHVQMYGNAFVVDPGLAGYDLQLAASLRDSSSAGFKIISGITTNAFVRMYGSNSFTGPLTISGLTTDAETPWVLGTTAGNTIVTNGGELFMYSTAITNETLILAGGTTFTAQYDCSWNGPVILNGNATLNGFTSPGLFSINGPISGTGNLTSTTPATNRFGGSFGNSYVGTTTVAAGSLVLANQGGINVPSNLIMSASSTVRLGNSEVIGNTADVLVNTGALLDFGGFHESINTLRGTGTVNFGAGSWLTIGGNNGTSEFDGAFTGIGYNLGGGGYTIGKNGSGTFTIGGNSTYTSGINHVFQGSLVVNGSQFQIPITVDAGASLGGSGIVGGIAADGTVTPGNSPGRLICSNIVFSASGKYVAELGGPAPASGYDQLNPLILIGANTLASATLQVVPAFTTPVAIGQQFMILSNSGPNALSGTFSGLPQGAGFAVGNYGFTISYTGGSGNDVVLTLTNIPGATVSSTIAAGNGDNYISPNECNSLLITITNKTGSPLTGISATLVSADPNVIVTQPGSTYADVPAHAKGTNLIPFQVSTLPGFLCGSNFTLNLSVVTSSQGAFTMPIVMSSGAPGVPVRFDNNNVTNVPDIGAIESTNVVGAWSGGQISKVAVSLWLVAPFSSDMTLSLVAPDGTTVPLASGVGAGANFGSGSADANRTTFDDAAATGIAAGSSPFVGTFRPESPLSALNGIAPVGAWHLRVQDSFGSGSPDTLRAWSLFLSGTTCADGGGACALCSANTLLTNTIDANNSVLSPRLFRDANPSGCGAAKVYPGNSGGTFRYQAYPFYNGSSTNCITVTLTPLDGVVDVFASTYLGSFNPANLTLNYLGDCGSSTAGGVTRAQSVSVPPNSVVVVVVNNVGNFGTYSLSVSGGDCAPVLNIIRASTNTVDVKWPTVAGGYNLEAAPSLSAPVWGGVTDIPVAVSNYFNVTNTSAFPATNRFYRLHAP